jgi:malate dehydrogenase (oxaloacetate-decarboxylating)(NADP+)
MYQKGMIIQPVIAAAKRRPGRLVYAEGEDERVLRAVQIVVDEQIARPILLGRAQFIIEKVRILGLRLQQERDYSVSRFDAAVDPSATLQGALLLRQGAADAMLCGANGIYADHLEHIRKAIGPRAGVATLAAMNVLMLPERIVFISDTYVNPEPTAEQIVDIVCLAVEEVRRFGLVPRVALLSHSSFGAADTPSALKMRRALQMLLACMPELEVDGEMHGDAALSRQILAQVRPNSRLRGYPNLLVMPSLDAANISFNMLKTAAGGGVTIGPILLGVGRPVQILTPTASVRRIVNMSALAVVDAAVERDGQ